LLNRSKIITNLAMAPESFRTVQDMVEDGKIQSVPKNYICREEDQWRPELSDGKMVLPELPLIDLEGSMDELGERRSIVVQQIRDACKDWGFFQVKNHGVPLSLIKRMQQVAHQVVELPADEKARIKQAHNIKDLNHAEGYKTRSASEGKVSHWSDRLRLHVFPVSSRNYNCWPTSPASFRETVEDYQREQDKLLKQLLELISEGLGLKTSCLNEYLAQEGMGTFDFSMNYYPPCPEPDLALGLPKHTDGGSINILLQDSTPGLQVLKNGEWTTVRPIEGAFVVNLGDHLEAMSNGRYKSVEHRVFVSAKPRLSIVSFNSPFEETIVCPIPEILQGSEEVFPKYKQCTFREYKAPSRKLYS
jgi:isopenicillin N synthase-like dioxygenase